MPSQEKSEKKTSDQINPIFKGGTSLISVKPVITKDSKCLLCGCGKKVRVYSIASGEIIHDLTGHTGTVSGITLSTDNPLQALSCASDKCVIRWDYMDGVLLQKYSFQFSVRCIQPWKKSDVASYTGLQENRHQGTDVVVFEFPKHKAEVNDIYTRTIITNVSEKGNCLAVGCGGDYIVGANSRKLLISEWHDKKRKFSAFCHTTRHDIESVASHPTQDCIATGDVDGAITLWYQFLESGTPVKTTVHWHCLPVLSLSFSTEGAFLLSGGHECVLVNWQVANLRKDFLPRLGSPITNIVSSKDGTLTVLCHVDNGIQVISNSSRKVIQIYQGLTQTRLNDSMASQLPAGMTLDPRTSSLVMNGRPGHIQFYSLHSDKQLYNLDIVGQNYISPDSLKKPLVVTEVENVAFNNDGNWLATVERRDDQETTPEIRLKFWLYAEKSHSYILNTSVETPHKGEIDALKFCPVSKDSLLMAVTTSKDGQFKLWALVDDTDIYRSNQCWNCESVGFYKELPAGPADFTQDGSLLAVGFASTLTLWDPSTNALRTHLNHPTSNTTLRHLVFGHGQSCHMLISSNATTLIGWNLLSCSAQWIIPFSADKLVADPRSDYFAAFQSNGKVCVFEAKNGSLAHEQSCPDQRILCAMFVPHKTFSETDITWQKKSQLYFINKKQELLTLGTLEDEHQTEASSGVKLHQDLPQTAFSRLLADKKTTGAFSESLLRLEGHRGQPGAHFMKELLGTPAHVLPPVPSLCLSFMDALALKAKKRDPFEKEEEEEEDDDDMDADTSDTSDSDEDDEKDIKMELDEAPKKQKDPTDDEIERKYDGVTDEAFAWFDTL